MLKVTVNITSDTLLDMLAIANSVSLELKEHGLDLVSASTVPSGNQWTIQLTVMDDEMQDEVDRNLQRAAIIAAAAQRDHSNVEIDEIPF